jgi:hypothetical protein
MTSSKLKRFELFDVLLIDFYVKNTGGIGFIIISYL